MNCREDTRQGYETRAGSTSRKVGITCERAHHVFSPGLYSPCVSQNVNRRLCRLSWLSGPRYSGSRSLAQAKAAGDLPHAPFLILVGASEHVEQLPGLPFSMWALRRLHRQRSQREQSLWTIALSGYLAWSV